MFDRERTDLEQEVVMHAEAVEPILKFFRYEHLPEHLQDQSFPFFCLAHFLFHNLPRNPERTVAWRKLLESKDAAVRAAL